MYNDKKGSQRNKKKTTDKKEENEFLSKFFRKRTKRLLTNIDRLFRKIMWIEIGISCISILLGVIFLLWPDISVTVLAVLFGINILASGILNVYYYFKRGDLPFFRFHLGYGIIGILLGILTILNPFIFSQVITIFLGFWILYLAITKIDLSLRLKNIKEESWLLLFITALLEIFMSILIFINPFSNLLITQVSGSFLILCGILNCMNAILTKNRALDFMEKL